MHSSERKTFVRKGLFLTNQKGEKAIKTIPTLSDIKGQFN